MSSFDWLALLSLIISAGTPLVIFLARNWLKARIEKGVQHHFDLKIEGVRAELRLSEERFKSDLREKENEITALRNSVLAGSASRQTLLDKKRFEAVQTVWTAVNDLAQLKGLSSFMAILKFEAVGKEASDPKMQNALAAFGGMVPNDAEKLMNVARNERPFLPELTWAYFSAYSLILYSALARYKILRIGLDDAGKYIKHDGLREVLKAALPHQSEWIDKSDPGAYYYLIDEIEASLLTELRKILEGKEADQMATVRAKEIMNAVKQADKEQAEADAKIKAH
jgi:hypothetical protein